MYKQGFNKKSLKQQKKTIVATNLQQQTEGKLDQKRRSGHKLINKFVDPSKSREII